MIGAETRSLYFANLASRYTTQKQIITGVVFFLSSGVVVSLLAKLPNAVAVTASLIVAAMSAYSIAVGLDKKIATMVMLHATWSDIATDYNYLWSHTSDDDAESRLAEIIRREREPSDLAATEARYNERLMEKWQNHVLASYHIGGKENSSDRENMAADAKTRSAAS